MQFRTLGKTGVRVSLIGLGGHEFNPDGSVKGFFNGRDATRRPDYTDPGFATPQRRELVQAALAAGINYFDMTIDPEVRALGQTLPADPSLLVQGRPQWMCYKYETGNVSLADLSKLRPEVERLLTLLKRPRLDVLNFGLESPALEQDDRFLDKVAANIRALKDAGLIRFASCDSIDSGERYYERMMRTGCFDLIWIHFGPLWPFPAQKLFPLAKELGLGVVTREAFTKGQLFKLAEGCSLQATRPQLAASAIRWILSHPDISVMILGMRNAQELQSNLAAADQHFSDQDRATLDRLAADPAFISALNQNERRFRA